MANHRVSVQLFIDRVQWKNAHRSLRRTMYSGEDPIDFANLLEKRKALSKTSHDAVNEGCVICHIPRTEHEIKVQRRRLCTFFPFYVLADAHLIGGSTSGCVFSYGLALCGLRS